MQIISYFLLMLNMKSLTKYVFILSVASSLMIVGAEEENPKRPIKETSGLKPFIVDGLPAAEGEFPWQVAFTAKTYNKGSSCGGSIIADQWILTAAHCIPKLDTVWERTRCAIFNVFTPRRCSRTNVGIILGTIDLKRGDKTVLKTTEVFVHPKYNKVTLEHDIALIKLNEKLFFNDKIQPIELSNKTLLGDVPVIISGFGQTGTNINDAYNSLNFVLLKTISNQQCNNLWGGKVAGDLIVCAVGTWTGSGSSCMGDSGGPLVEISADGKARQVGVASFVSGLGCESGLPSGYSRTAPHIPWIKEQINDPNFRDELSQKQK